jgi:hypothetical protein
MKWPHPHLTAVNLLLLCNFSEQGLLPQVRRRLGQNDERKPSGLIFQKVLPAHSTN